MRARFLHIAMVCFLGGQLNAQTVEERLKWARANIDAHASMRFSGSFSDAAAGLNETTWHVTRIEGCLIELKQTWLREPREGRTVEYSLDLSTLHPEDVMHDISTGLPHVKIFAQSDVFRLSTRSTAGWSGESTARNLWMYFDSPSADNAAVVKKVAKALRGAISQCRGYQR